MTKQKSIHQPHCLVVPLSAKAATLLAVVAETQPRHSVALRLLNHEGWQPVGNVTIPTSRPVPKIGAVVEVRYRNTARDGSLYQPAYLGERSDVRQDECVVSQLRFKREDDEGN